MKTIPDELVGYSEYRLKDNEAEQAFHDHWIELNERNSAFGSGLPTPFLNTLMTKGVLHYPPQVPLEQSKVAAHMIQWLGSHVGQSFLIDVINTCPTLKQNIKHNCFD